jgi:hypothetical protein
MISMTTDLFNSHDPKMVYSCDLALTDQEERERIRELSRSVAFGCPAPN